MKKLSVATQLPDGSEAKRTDDLGTKLIEDIPVQGRKIVYQSYLDYGTMVIAIEVSCERWVSEDFGTEMAKTMDYPGNPGFRTEYVFESFSRQEPDPALFAPPRDYKIVKPQPKRAAPR